MTITNKIKLNFALLKHKVNLTRIQVIGFENSNDYYLWSHGNEGFAGFGNYRKLNLRGPKRFDDARKLSSFLFAELDFVKEENIPNFVPIVFASFSFNQIEDSLLVIPEITIGQMNGVSWITWIGESARPIYYETMFEQSDIDIVWSLSDDKTWKEKVAQVIDKIENKNLDKLVLARFEEGRTSKKINVREVVNQLAKKQDPSWVYASAGLIGATPELLIKKSQHSVSSRVLAGTISRAGDDKRDLHLVNLLSRSSKDLEEHKYAVKSVADALAPLCSSINIPESPFVLRLSNVMHLATDVTGLLGANSSPADIFDLVSRLHPSAAVCGTPTEVAQRTIDEIEGISRGRYAGPIGWIDANGDGEFGIALRCGQVSNDAKSIRIYAGCGIVAGSDPEREYAESQAKLLSMRNALEIH